jgi:azurin
MKTKFLTALAIVAAVQLCAAGTPGKDVVIVANDQMKFSVTHIEARPGQTVHVTLSNEGTMPKAVMGHNWVLLKAGVDANAYANAAMAAAADDYEPKARADQVLASIPLLGPKKEGEVTFDAPQVSGTYFFLCSFPAHCQAGMRGELVVK